MKPRPLTAYSRRLSRGILAGLPLDGRTYEGRVARQLERELLEHIGGPPNAIERLLIRQCVRQQLQLDWLGMKLLGGDFTDHDRRVFGALNNSLRLTLRELSHPVQAHYRDGRRSRSDPQAEIARLVSESRARKAAQHGGAK
jgi:hypothetical protein